MSIDEDQQAEQHCSDDYEYYESVFFHMNTSLGTIVVSNLHYNYTTSTENVKNKRHGDACAKIEV